MDNVKFDMLKVRRTRPAISYWSSEMIRVREDFEQDEGGFGLREINGPYVEEEAENVSDDDDDDDDEDSLDQGLSVDVSFVCLIIYDYYTCIFISNLFFLI